MRWALCAALHAALATAQPQTLDKAVQQRAEEQVNVAAANVMSAQVAVGEAKVHEQTALADTALTAAEDAYEIARNSVPVSKASATETRVAAYNTEQTVKVVQAARDTIKAMPLSAAKAAVKVVMAGLKAEAISEAEKKAADDAANFAARKDKIIAHSGIGAMMPYHLAIMRAQKNSAEYKHRADSATTNAMALVGKAEQMAADANALQAGGHVFEANQAMMTAHGMMNEAVKMKQWGEKFQAIAGKVGGGVPVLDLEEGMAGAAIGNPIITQVDSPMALPFLLQRNAHTEKTSKIKLR